MRRLPCGLLSFLFLFSLPACSGGKKESGSSAEGIAKKGYMESDPDMGGDRDSLEAKYADFGKTFEQDEQGNWMVSDKARRSQFEGKKVTSIGGGAWSNGSRTKSQYSNKAWGGSRDYSKKSFGKDLSSRYNGSEWFLKQQAAGEASKRARAEGQVYGTGSYRTGRANEGRASDIARVSDAETDQRRAVFTGPVIMTPEEAGMTQSQVNQKLGRLTPGSVKDDE